MDTPSTLARTETELRSQLEDWAHAVRARDIDRIVATTRRTLSPSMPSRNCSSRAPTPIASTGKPA